MLSSESDFLINDKRRYLYCIKSSMKFRGQIQWSGNRVHHNHK